MGSKCTYDYICVIDFEATCQERKIKDFFPHEIIEFPSILIDPQKQEIVGNFHAFVKPTLNPKLTAFCKNLTGISQDSVNNAEYFPDVLAKFLAWIKSYVTLKESLIILTDGNWDLAKFLCLQCLISKVDFPSWANEWIDLKRIYKSYHKVGKVKLMDMLHTYGLQFSGHLHSGKDDTYNIAQLVLTMLKCGCEFSANAILCPESTKTLKSKLSTYLKMKQKRKKENKKSSQYSPEVCEDESPDDGSMMEVDPDLIGCETVLLQYKFKKT